jgi:hypothetical protein
MATACRYQAARASESFNLMQHCIFGRFRRFVGTDSPEFMGSIRTRSEVHILEHGVAGAFQIGVRLAGNSLIWQTPALPNRRPKPLCISLTGGGDKGIAKPFAFPNRPYAEYRTPTLRTAAPPANTSVATGKCSMSRSPQRRSMVRAVRRRLLHIPGKGHHGGNNRENCSNVERNEIQR